MNSIPGFVGEAKFGQVHIDSNEIKKITDSEVVGVESEQITGGEAVGVEVELIQSKADKTLTSPQLTEEEKEEILMKLDDINFLEVLMNELSVDTSKMLLIIENSNIISDKKSGQEIHIQLDTGDDYYIDMSTYNRVFNAYYPNE